jgi:MarR family transcriptional regulator, organic hydroperoxide resistance regulator
MEGPEAGGDMRHTPKDGHDALKFDFPEADPLATEAFRQFMRAMHLHRQAMARSFSENGRNMAQAGCLRLLSAHDGISQRDLAEELHLSRPTVTTMLQAVEKDGIIVRRPDELDQRLTRVYLTDEGRRLAGRLRSVVSGYVNATFGSLPEEDRRELARILGDLNENTSKALG